VGSLDTKQTIATNNTPGSSGYFLPPPLLELFPKGAINIHPSLLPKYRGPAPIQHALINGDAETGVSIIEVDPQKFDSGAILVQEQYKIDEEQTFSTLAPELSDLGAMLLLRVLTDVNAYKSTKREQGNEGATKAAKPRTEDKFISDWSSAVRNRNKFRAFDTLHCRFLPGNQNLAFVEVHLPSEKESYLHSIKGAEKACLLLRDRSALAVKFADGWLLVNKLKLEGKSTVTALEFYNGYLLRREKTIEGVIEGALA
jgi:methionyl-tRNA formyltransferase